MSKKNKILLIDDAMLMRNLLKNILTTRGYDICGEAETGEVGIEMYKEHRPDLTICDINMPGMNGIECLREIFKIDSNAKIIMCTSMGEQCFAEEAVAAGAKGYIVKPMAAADVVKTVGQVLAMKNYKDLMMERALASGLEQKEILDFFDAFRAVTEYDMGDRAITKEYLQKKKENIAIGAEAFLAAKMPLDKVNALVDVLNCMIREGI